MIELPRGHRLAVDAAIERVLDRLRRRTAPLGDGARALAEAIASAVADGKRLRPALVVTSFEAFGGDAGTEAALWDVAAAFELLHTAFLVHDDVIDHDVERRGVPNVAGRFRDRATARGADDRAAGTVGDAAGVLAGDLLLFEATRMIAAAPLATAARGQLLETLDEAVLVSAIGELADAEHAAHADCPDADVLLATAHDKTAVYTFRAPLRAGAILAGADPAPLAESAADLGLAFQLVDDLIGTFGTRRQAGREPGADLREAKRTPLIALARRTESWPQVSSALALAATGPIAVRRAQHEIEASGARTELEVLIRRRLQRARSHAASPRLPRAAGALLGELADAIEERIP